MAQISFSQIAFRVARGAIETDCNPNRNPIKPIVGIALFSWRHRQTLQATLDCEWKRKTTQRSIVAMLQVSSFVGKDLRFFHFLRRSLHEWMGREVLLSCWFNQPWVTPRDDPLNVSSTVSQSATHKIHTHRSIKKPFFTSLFFRFEQSRNFLLAFTQSYVHNRALFDVGWRLIKALPHWRTEVK